MIPRLQSSLCSMVFIVLLGSASCAFGADNPVADPRALIIDKNARFTILTPHMIRLEWSADGVFEDHASFVVINRRLPVPEFSTTDKDGSLVIKTPALVLTYKKGAGKFTADNLSIAFSLNGIQQIWHPGDVDTANLQGTTRTLDGVEGRTSLEPGLVSKDGWVVIDDHERPLLDGTDWPWVMSRPAGERQDLYFLGYGHNYRQTLADFIQIAGRIPIPPRFAFGTWWSRYWAYTDEEMKDLVRQFDAHDVPLDVLVIDMDWHLTFDMRWSRDEHDQAGQRLGWTGYTWDRNYFPEPTKFLSWVHEQGLKSTLNIHPASGIQPHEDAYPAMARSMGVNPSTKQYVPFDITNKKFASNYMNIVMHGLEHQGIDFFWLDWQQWTTTAVPGVTPTWWLNYVFFTDKEREGKERPLLFHRWGGLGNHRYQIGFSGDVVSVWPSLAYQPYFTATAANVGFGYWSHDIGGHMPGIVTPELYTRWIQFGVFSPILRTHTTKNPEAERRIWAYPTDDFLRMRDAFRLRYALIPYLYTEARSTYDNGVSISHPLYYDYPEMPEAYSSADEYLFGSKMLVAPVVTPASPDSMLAARNIWLPPGEWYEWFTGSIVKGGQRLIRLYALDEIPVFLRAGSIIPMQPPMNRTSAKPVDPLILAVAPGDTGSTLVYEDQGNSTSYRGGECSWTPVRQSGSETARSVVIDPVRGSYPGMLESRAYQVQLLSVVPPVSVRVDGKTVVQAGEGKVGWWYDGEHTTLNILTGKTSSKNGAKVDVVLPQLTESQRTTLNGLPGKIARMKRVMPLLNHQWPIEWTPPALVHQAQTGNRLGLNPEKGVEELTAFEAAQKDVFDALRAMTLPESVRTKVMNHLSGIQR